MSLPISLPPSQQHLISHLPSLSSEDQLALSETIIAQNFTKLSTIFDQALEADKAISTASVGSIDLKPPPEELYASTIGGNSKDDEKRWYDLGLKAVSEGKVGIILLAGGQGSRLGSSAPKGCYDIGLPSRKSLFQLQAEKIKKLQELAGGKEIRWYVMTSGPTRKDTENFFKENKFWGLKESQIVFFEQGTLPCYSNDGSVFLASPTTLTSAPDGNGGIYAALSSPHSINTSPSSPPFSVLEDMSAHSIQYLHAYCVDNCLVKIGDPTFVGYCIERGAETGVKVVRKEDPEESVGVIALKNGKWSVVEYSEIPKEVSKARNSGGELTFRAANIANHFYTLSFLKSIDSFSSQMAYHVARKKIPYYDPKTGETIKPSSPNGIKLELFIFDVFPFVNPLQKMAVLEVERKEEFSPLKNGPGTASDNPETSRKDLLEQQKRWIEVARGSVAEGVEVELGSGVTYGGEGLEGLKGKKLVKSGVVESWAGLEALLG